MAVLQMTAGVGIPGTYLWSAQRSRLPRGTLETSRRQVSAGMGDASGRDFTSRHLPLKLQPSGRGFNGGPLRVRGAPLYYLTFAAVSGHGVGVGLRSTNDWRQITTHGMILPPHNKDCALFDAPIGGLYYALHPPSSPALGGNYIWLAESPDLLHWGNHRCVAHSRPGLWDSARVGAGDRRVAPRLRENPLSHLHRVTPGEGVLRTVAGGASVGPFGILVADGPSHLARAARNHPPRP